MEKLTQQELNGIVEKHGKWLRDEKGGKRAVLSGKDLSGLILIRVALSDADLTNANLRYATLRNADLTGADMTGADLSGANLRNANLRNANLTNADLADALLYKATLINATLPEFQIPQYEDLIVWKKLKHWYTHGKVLCKLLIPADVARTANLVGKKCRAAKAKVLEFQDLEGNVLDLEKVAHGPYNSGRRPFTYTKGAEVVPDEYNPDIREECTHGIHFFLTKEEALDW